MKAPLLKTLRDIERADSDPLRQALFQHLRETNLAVRLVWRIHQRLGSSYISSALVFLFGVKSYVLPGLSARDGNKALAVAVRENARKQVRQLASWIGEDSVAWLRLDASQLLSPQTYGRLLKGMASWKTCLRLYRTVDRLNRRHDFLVSCRSASALFSYVRAKEIFRRYSPSGVIVSSDSNPEPLAFARAAAASRVPTVFISHAYPTPVSPRLQFTLSILEGQAALDRYERKGPARGRVIFCGAEGDSEPMRPERARKRNPTVGIFAPKVILWPQFAALIEDCRRFFAPSRILIRWHPSMLDVPRLAAALEQREGIEETDPDQSLQAVARECDWAIADENSNVHLGVLKAGVPTVSMRELSVLPASRSDLYGFVENRIVPPPVASLSELSLDELVEFFSGDWPERFRMYDASYLIPSAAVIEKVRDDVLRVLVSGRAPIQS